MKQRLAEEFPDSPSLEIIQGGMGIRVSSYQLAGAVASHEATGLVSGTAIGTVLLRGLNDGDPTGDLRWALEQYPRPEIAEHIVDRFYRPNGRDGKPYDRPPAFNIDIPKGNKITPDLAVVGAFAEVLLAKRNSGGRGIIGMNLLTKVDIPNAHTLYGAMQAGVDLVAMGAGLPTEVPQAMRDMAAAGYAEHAKDKIVKFPVKVANSERNYFVELDTTRYETDVELEVPRFLMIITLDILAKRFKDIPDGFIIEEPIAGGHNAPPRPHKEGPDLDERGQPIYSERDYANLEKMRALDVPFWLAGGYGTREGLKRARSLGARGVQIGSIFAMAEESGMTPELKNRMISQIRGGTDIDVFTDPLASPTNYPFKVAGLEGTMSEPEVYAKRTRICDLGYLRTAVEVGNHRATGEQDRYKLEYRCASEPIKDYLRKGGTIEETIGRKCICNGLAADIGMGQIHDGVTEAPIVTIGDAVSENVRAINGRINAESILRSLRGE